MKAKAFSREILPTAVTAGLPPNQGTFSMIGIGGSGRASATKLAAFMSDYELFQIEITKTYTFADWREDVKKMLRKAGCDGVSTVFLFGDHQLKVRRCNSNVISNVFAPRRT